MNIGQAMLHALFLFVTVMATLGLLWGVIKLFSFIIGKIEKSISKKQAGKL